MPELPDVETFKNYFNATSLHQKIKHTAVKDKRILENVSAIKLNSRLKGKSFDTALRHGKYMFAPAGNNLFLLFHYGMTGLLKYFKDIEGEPRHSRFLITFTSGYHLGFACQRLLGNVSIVESVENFIRDNKLGPDALDIDFKTFQQAHRNSSAAIKPVLMNQSAIAGIGNIYSDEILFQAGLYPKTSAKEISDTEIKKLHRAAQRVLKTTIKKQADPKQLPNSYLLVHRGKGGKCGRCGTGIKSIKVGGRTAYYCPHCQKPQG